MNKQLYMKFLEYTLLRKETNSSLNTMNVVEMKLKRNLSVFNITGCKKIFEMNIIHLSFMASKTKAFLLHILCHQ